MMTLLWVDLGMAIAMETKKLRQIQRALSSSDSDKQRQERVQVIQDSGFKIPDMGFRVQGSEFRVRFRANIDESRSIIHQAAFLLPDYRGREASSAGA